ncbi:unnamed protein product, partial [Prorocentrum cordatum]
AALGTLNGVASTSTIGATTAAALGTLNGVASTSTIGATTAASPSSAPPGVRSSGSSSLRALGLPAAAASPPPGPAAAAAAGEPSGLLPGREAGSTPLAQSPRRQLSTAAPQFVTERLRTTSEPRVSSKFGVQAQAPPGWTYAVASTSDVRASSPPADPALLTFAQKARPTPFRARPPLLQAHRQRTGTARSRRPWRGHFKGLALALASGQAAGWSPGRSLGGSIRRRRPCPWLAARGRRLGRGSSSRPPAGARCPPAPSARHCRRGRGRTRRTGGAGGPGAHQRLGPAGCSSHAPCGSSSHAGGATLLGRGRSSSPAGVTDAQATAPPARQWPAVATPYAQSSIAVLGAQARAR